MDDEKLVRLLREIARVHAPHILNNQTWQSDKAGRLYLARSLAYNDCLVLLGYIPPSHINQTSILAQTWSGNFLRFYDLFAGQLFGTFRRREIRVQPRGVYQIAILFGEARDLIIAMANYLVPYLDARALGLVDVGDHQIQIILREMLSELGGKHISSPVYEHLLASGTAIVHDMVEQPIHQQSLTEFKKPLIYVKPRPGAPLPRTGKLNPEVLNTPPKPNPPSKPVQNGNQADSSVSASKKQPDPQDRTLERFPEETGQSTALSDQETEQNTEGIVYKLIPDSPGKSGKETSNLPLYLRKRKNHKDKNDKGV